MSLNQEGRYEVTPQQRDYVARKLLLSGAWSTPSRALFQLFSPNFDTMTFEVSVSSPTLPPRYSAAASILQATGVLEADESRMWVTPSYVAAVRDLRADRRGVTEKELEAALMANKALGSQAEEAVLAFERRRLRAMGRAQEALVARRISDLTTDAGYDIESFDGTRPALDYDRYIEVKASSGPEVRFYWTRNQYLVAQNKGAQYWIYFVAGFKPAGSRHVEPVMIQDPIATLPRVPSLSLETAEYIVYQNGEVPLAREEMHGVRASRPVLKEEHASQP